MEFLVAVLLIILIPTIIYGVVYSNKSDQELARCQRADDVRLHGPVNQSLICPHCQEKGYVHTKSVQQKKGISGGKATAALLTGGVSMLATGLSRKEQATEAYCGNCKSTWTF